MLEILSQSTKVIHPLRNQKWLSLHNLCKYRCQTEINQRNFTKIEPFLSTSKVGLNHTKSDCGNVYQILEVVRRVFGNGLEFLVEVD